MIPETVLRKATVNDLPRMLELESAAFGGDAFSRRQLKYLIEKSQGLVLVAVREDLVVGYMSVLTRKGGVGRIYSITVDRAFRGKGIADALVDKTMEFMRGSGVTTVFLEVRVDNPGAIALYEKRGFIRRGIKRGYYHDGSDAYWMSVPLLPSSNTGNGF